METTLQPSLWQTIRSKIGIIEAIELALLAFAFWCLGMVASIGDPDTSLLDALLFLVVTEGIALGSWVVYNVYIFIARAGGTLVDVGLWVAAASLTASYTFWAWTILDVNRFLISKLLYRGEAPVEFAWSANSKKYRKAWEVARRAGRV